MSIHQGRCDHACVPRSGVHQDMQSSLILSNRNIGTPCTQACFNAHGHNEPPGVVRAMPIPANINWE